MTNWPSSWRENTLRMSDIPISDFALNVLHLWEQSTPTDRWTNNPLGVPAEGYAAPRALGSPYAAFPSMNAFFKAFTTAAHAGNGKPLYTMLGTSENHAEAWRVIHSLNWPANLTETDHPVKVLDKTDEGVRERIQSTKPGERKTVGVEPASVSHRTAIRAQMDALHQTATQHTNTSLAIKFIAGAMRNHG